MADKVLDVINNNFNSVSISRGKYEDLLKKELLYDDMADLITHRALHQEGITYEQVKLIYEMHIKPAPVDEIEIHEAEKEAVVEND